MTNSAERMRPLARTRRLIPLGLIALMIQACSSYSDKSWPDGYAHIGGNGINAPGQHMVLPGDTLSEIAERYGVRTRDLVRLNGLLSPDKIYAGQVLRVPSPAARVHVVAHGEYLSGIAERYHVSTTQLAAANGLRDPSHIMAGQRLTIPGDSAGASPSRPASATPPARSKPTPTPVVPAVPKPRDVQLASVEPSHTPAPAQPARKAVSAEAAHRGAHGTPPARTGRDFLWPANGKVVAAFGQADNGRINHGINIAAPKGAPVRAAENGIVAYADDEVKGYGQMILIRHADDYITAYAHNAQLLVEVGDTVKRGDIIARVGTSGSVKDPQLHFELRRERKPLDPIAYLGARPTSLAQQG